MVLELGDGFERLGIPQANDAIVAGDGERLLIGSEVERVLNVLRPVISPFASNFGPASVTAYSLMTPDLAGSPLATASRLPSRENAMRCDASGLSRQAWRSRRLDRNRQ